MTPLTRSTSLSRAQQLAAQLPDSVENVEDVRTVVEMALEVAQALEVPLPSVTEISTADKRFTSSRVHALAKDAIPELTKTVNGTAAFGPVVAKTITSLVKSVAFLSSDQHRQSIADTAVQAVLQDPRIAELLGDPRSSLKRPAEDAEASSGARKKPVKRNKNLETVVHFHFHQLHGKRFESPGYPVLSNKTEWEDPCPPLFKKDMANEDGSIQTVRCPDWESDRSDDSHAFRAEVVAAAMLDPEWQDEPRSKAVKIAETYWKRIVAERRKAKDADLAEADRVAKELKGAHSRTTKLVKTMMSSLVNSKIGECFEGRLIKAAILSGALDPTFWAHDERHPFPKPWIQTIDQSEEGVEPVEGDVLNVERGFDAWKIYADRKVEGYAGEKPKLWAIDQPQWWSHAVKLGFWYVYEESQPKGGGNFGRTPLFHVPSALSTQVAVATLPRLSPSSSKELSVLSKPVGSNSRGNTHFEVSESMVEGEWANDPAYRDWLDGLFKDPPSLPAENDLPSIADWIQALPDQDLRQRVLSHMEPPPMYDEEVLERLWRLRGVDLAAYKAAVRSDDWAAHFALLDVVAGMPPGSA